MAGRIEAELRGRGFAVVDTAYGAFVDITIGVEPGHRARLDSFLAETTQGLVDAHLIGTEWIETDC